MDSDISDSLGFIFSQNRIFGSVQTSNSEIIRSEIQMLNPTVLLLSPASLSHSVLYLSGDSTYKHFTLITINNFCAFMCFLIKFLSVLLNLPLFSCFCYDLLLELTPQTTSRLKPCGSVGKSLLKH